MPDVGRQIIITIKFYRFSFYDTNGGIGTQCTIFRIFMLVFVISRKPILIFTPSDRVQNVEIISKMVVLWADWYCARIVAIQ